MGKPEVIGDKVACEYPYESKDECCEDASLMVAGDKLSYRSDYERDYEQVG